MKDVGNELKDALTLNNEAIQVEFNVNHDNYPRRSAGLIGKDPPPWHGFQREKFIQHKYPLTHNYDLLKLILKYFFETIMIYLRTQRRTHFWEFCRKSVIFRAHALSIQFQK